MQWVLSLVGFLGLALRDRACARRQALRGGGFRAVREGMMIFACNARSGPVPRPPRGVWLGGDESGI
jgi:hypothetical protein